MSNPPSTNSSADRYLQLWLYFLPIVGVIPAAWTLFRTKNKVLLPDNPLQDYSRLDRQRKASRLSINLTLIWLCSYILFSYGANDATAIVSFRLLFANAMSTTGYFVSCVYFMSRIGKKRLFSID